MVLLLLIPLAWLTVVAFVVALCLMAARADSAPSVLLEMSAGEHDDGPLAWDAAGPVPLAARRAPHGRARMRGARLSRSRRRVAARDVR